eukprot:Seg1850.6 transcript_id=Seg1850.6/GoldUCD/mRNA.D3Y31 product="RING finger protein 37" protein_id=Seg1850.6/GoldUCD/D3Y31
MDYFLDLANKDLGTSIHTNVVTADGYEIENLIEKSTQHKFEASPKFGLHISQSSNNRNYSNGFMAEYFVKPPMDIVVQFPCLVDIDCLVLNRRSGSKRVSEFTVFTANSRPVVENEERKIASPSNSSTDHERKYMLAKTKSRAKFPTEEAEIPSAFPFEYEPNYSDTSVRKENLTNLTMVGKLNSRTATNDVAIFRNARNSNGKGIEFEKQGNQTINFFSLQFLYGISHLIIRIFRTEGSTVAAVKSLEVWGRPSRNNGRLVNNHVYGLVKKMKKQQDLKRSSNGCKKLTSNPEKKLNENDKPGTSIKETCVEASNACSSLEPVTSKIIPEEFIDPITFEIMVLPVLLPSGHTIDSSTLEKCTQADKNNGRDPLDPFTGKTLTEINKTIPNTALKFRLDEFLLKNNVTLGGDVMGQTSGVNLKNGFSTVESMKCVKRKLDNNPEIVSAKKHFRISHIIKGTHDEKYYKDRHENLKDSKLRMDDDVKKDFFPDTSPKEPISCEKMLGNKLQIVQDKTHTARAHDSSNDTTKIVAKCFGSIYEPEQQNEGDTVSSKFSHEQSLKDSLETALQKMRSSFTKPCAKSQQENSTTKISCSICKVSEKDAGFFKLPCNHLICRTCLTKNAAQNKCKLCLKSFSNSEITRVHFSSYFNNA